ncbi:MAG TPA: FAD-dependent oxidoreductase [Gaiellales bacterium]|jgi:sulfide:quinone oxidoreductase
MGAQAKQQVRVLVVGSGVAALEFVLAAHKVAEERLHCTIVTPQEIFSYRPASVAVPFGQAEVFRYPLAGIADAAGAEIRHSRVSAVDTARRVARLEDGDELDYDALVIATGARRVPVLDEAITFRGEEDIPQIELLLDDIDRRHVHRVAFALPAGATWPLPLYELALLTSAHVAKQPFRSSVSISFVTPEHEPLAVFGGEASATVKRLLDERGIELHTGTHPASLTGGRLVLVPPGTLDADRVVCMPAARGTPIPGLPHDFEGFIPVDAYGRAGDAPDVYAIGDATNRPIKQGGIAAEQADHLAQLLAHQAGAPVDEPPRYAPTLKGLLLTGEEPQYLQAEPTGGHGASATISSEPLWWPGGKIAAPHLASHLVRAARS